MDIRDAIKENKYKATNRDQIIFLRQAQVDGCVRYRLDMVIKSLAHYSTNFSFLVNSGIDISQLYFSDIIMGLQISRFPDEEGLIYSVADWAKINNVRFVLDYNDDVFNIPVTNPAQKMTEKQKQVARDIIGCCDALSCTTEPMRQVIKRDNTNVAIIPNYFDMWNYRQLLVTADEVEQRWRKHNKKTVVGFIGAANHTDDQDIFYDAMTMIMRERHNVEVASFGFVPRSFYEEFGARCHMANFTTLEAYMPQFSELKVDILCIPLVNDSFNACKSNIKWLEGSHLGAACIASPIPAYKELGDSVCMLVDWNNDNPLDEIHEWRTSIEHLIDDPIERFERVHKSQELMVRDWDLAVGWVNWETYIKKVLNEESVADMDVTPRYVEVKHEEEISGKENVRVSRKSSVA